MWTQARLTAAMAPRLSALTPDEQRRNSHGATLLFAAEGHPLFEPIRRANAIQAEAAEAAEAAGAAEGAEAAQGAAEGAQGAQGAQGAVEGAQGAQGAVELARGCGIAGRVAPRPGAPEPSHRLAASLT